MKVSQTPRAGRGYGKGKGLVRGKDQGAGLAGPHPPPEQDLISGI